MPLQGIRVVDLTRILSGPFCTQLLADLGAEVIKIEGPRGDPVRHQGEFVNGLSWYFAQFNRNKKSSYSTSTTKDKNTLSKLLRTADVLVENFRPGILLTWVLVNGKKKLKSTINSCQRKGVRNCGALCRPPFI
ncbi:MAG: hypothetical protein CM1200mP39_29650 [Dehalococcoidia bacterium]|nr:MAG: hypothetical protein CM1200mP39_29650 [Dehalococcoidia bacterium]